MKNSACLLFPFKYDNENECMARAHTVEDTVVSAIRVFVCTRKGSRVGNNIGSFLPELLLTGVPLSQLSNLSEELKKELKEQFPGVDILGVTMERQINENSVSLMVTITISVATLEGSLDISLDLPSIFTQ
jgi:phage baseplate assembly protein W